MGILVAIGIIIIAIIIATISSAIGSKARGKTIKATKEKQEQIIRKYGITKSVDFEWHDFANEHMHRFIVDDKAKKIYVSTGIDVYSLNEIPYREIIGFEVIEDSHVTGGIKRAVVGGVLAGDAGAIVGAQTAHKKAVSSMKAVIYRKNIGSPQYIFEFIESETPKDSFDYTSAKEFTEKVSATLKAIMAINAR